jgi:hypothetical protein
MMGQQLRTDSLFYYFRLEDEIPEGHLLRLTVFEAAEELGGPVDFQFLPNGDPDRK